MILPHFIQSIVGKPYVAKHDLISNETYNTHFTGSSFPCEISCTSAPLERDLLFSGTFRICWTSFSSIFAPCFKEVGQTFNMPVFLCIGRMILETDGSIIAGKVATHNMDDGAPLSEQVPMPSFICNMPLRIISVTLKCHSKKDYPSR